MHCHFYFFCYGVIAVNFSYTVTDALSPGGFLGVVVTEHEWAADILVVEISCNVLVLVVFCHTKISAPIVLLY